MHSTSLRWYVLDLRQSSLRLFATRLLRARYNDRDGHGFVLEDVRTGDITGRHIERIQNEYEYTDPYGQPLRQQVTRYREASFVLRAEQPGLEIRGSHRAPRLMISQLSVIAGTTLVVSTIKANPATWLSQIEHHLPASEVRRIECSDIDFRGGVAGVLSVTGPTDVRAATANILGKRPHSVRRIVSTITNNDGRKWHLTLHRDGWAGVSGEDPTRVSDALRASLLKSAELGDL